MIQTARFSRQQARHISRIASKALRSGARPWFRPLFLAIYTGLFGVAATHAIAADVLPGGLTVVNGQVSSVQSGSKLTLTTSDKSVLNWQSFSIGAQNTVVFNQPNATSQVLNRVVGQDPSSILGSLQSNGKVWLLNPNGVLFGKDARIDVGGLVASSLHMDTADFLGGRYNLKTAADGSGSVINQGSITTPYGGQVMLVGSSVQNSGSITTPGGHTGLIAADQVELTDTATPFMSVRVPVKAGQVDNTGSVSAQRIDIYGGVVNQTGTLTATSMTQDASGQIVLRASGNATLAAGSTTQAAGGAIEGTSEAGVLQVDGVVSANAATYTGNGGSIILWGEQALGVRGQVSARGGDLGGNGGFIETSTHGGLDIRSVPDAGAPKGKAGTWLIDPYDISIVAGGGTTSINSGTPFVPTGNAAQLGVDLISSALNAGTNVNVSTGVVGSAGTGNGDITINEVIRSHTPISATGPTLTMTAARNIYFANNGDIDASGGSTDGSLNVSLRAGQDILKISGPNGGVWTNGGSATITAGGKIAIMGVGTGSNNPAHPDAGSVSISSGGGDVQLVGLGVAGKVTGARGGDVTINLGSSGSNVLRIGLVKATGTASAVGGPGTLQVIANGALELSGVNGAIGDGQGGFIQAFQNSMPWQTGLTVSAKGPLTLNAALTGVGLDIKLVSGDSIALNGSVDTVGGSLFLDAGNPTASAPNSVNPASAITQAIGTTIKTGLGSLNSALNGSTGTVSLHDVTTANFINTGSAVLDGVWTLNSLDLRQGSQNIGAGATINVTGAISLSPSTILTLAGGALNAASLSTSGTVNANSGNLSLGSIAINSGGIFNYALPGATTVTGVTNNAGTLKINTSTLNLAGGYIQSAGLIQLGSSVAASADVAVGGAGLFINGGTLGGSGTIAGNVTVGAGILAPGYSPGSLNITGNLTLGAGSTATIELGGTAAGTGYDQINVTGVANLNGTLNVLQFGGYVPAASTLFNYLTFGSSAGSFATVTYGAPANAWAMTNTQLASSAQLLMTAPAPAPAPTPTPTPITTSTALDVASVVNSELWRGFALEAVGAPVAATVSVSGTPELNTPAVTLLAAPQYSGASVSILDTIPSTGLPGAMGNTGSATTESNALPSYRYMISDQTNVYFRVLPLDAMAVHEIDKVLLSRREYKKNLFASSIVMLEQNPALPDLPGCSSVTQADSGTCVVNPADNMFSPVLSDKPRRAERQIINAAVPRIVRKIAVVVGMSKYDDKRIPQLIGAEPDANAVNSLLAQEMGYDVVMLNSPNKSELFSALNTVAINLKENDSLLVYYAGHGEMVERTGMGYWLLRDAKADDPKGWVSNADLNQLLARSKSKQMAVVADSCYSGRFAAEGKVVSDVKATTQIEDLLSRRAVTMMSSGGDEPVADTGKEGHSVFAWNLMKKIREVNSWSAGGDVYDTVKTEVERELPQTPQYGASLAAGHQPGADFVFERRTRGDVVR